MEVTKFEADFTLMDTCWVPSSPRLIALGSTLGGRGQIAVLSLSGLSLSSLISHLKRRFEIISIKIVI